jgi:hypothetical protein
VKTETEGKHKKIQKSDCVVVVYKCEIQKLSAIPTVVQEDEKINGKKLINPYPANVDKMVGSCQC